MKAWVHRTSGELEDGKVAEFETLESLMAFIRAENESSEKTIGVVILPAYRPNTNIPEGIEWEIEIYDRYRE